jgi:putative copper export protein
VADAGVVLPITWSTVRLFLHVVAATVWVGGQLTLAALVPALRAAGPEVPRAAAQAFNQVAWGAFVVLVVTGLWNIMVVEPTWDSPYGRTLMLKLVFVVLSGVTAFLHARARSRMGLAVFGAASGISALAVVFLAVQL